jgi:GAF domain-containing protein
MTMPLRIGDDIIGVMDIQSNQSAAFQDQDVELLTIVADQISIAIQNARQFQAAQKALAEAEATSRQYVHREWASLASDGKHLGYRYSRAGVGPLKAPVRAQEIDVAIVTGKTHSTVSSSQSQLAVPIKLRGEIIGVLNVKSEGQRKWDQDEIDISEAVAERVALAIENARLVEASQFQATRERTIGEIASRIGASVNMRNVLQTAVEELGRILPGSDVIIQLGKESE